MLPSGRQNAGDLSFSFSIVVSLVLIRFHFSKFLCHYAFDLNSCELTALIALCQSWKMLFRLNSNSSFAGVFPEHSNGDVVFRNFNRAAAKCDKYAKFILFKTLKTVVASIRFEFLRSLFWLVGCELLVMSACVCLFSEKPL